MTVSIKPLDDRIVIQQVEAEETTASGLVLPDTAKEKPQEGKVVAVGPGRIDDNGNRVPMDLAVGDTVIYSKYGGTEVKYGADEYIILSQRDVLAVVTRHEDENIPRSLLRGMFYWVSVPNPCEYRFSSGSPRNTGFCAEVRDAGAIPM